MPVTFDTACQMALALDHVEEGTSYGTPGFKVRGALLARHRPEIDSLVVRVDVEQRAELMAAGRRYETCSITDHYLNYPWVRLGRVHPDALRDLLRGAWRAAVAKKRRGGRR